MNRTELNAWITRTLTLVLGLVLAQLGAAAARRRALKRIERIPTPDWTVRVHEFSETNSVVTLFRRYLLVLLTAFMIVFTPELNPQQALRIAALSMGLAILSVDPSAKGWVSRATGGRGVEPSWWERQRRQWFLFPTLYVVMLFAALAPQSYDAYGQMWAAAVVASLFCAEAGGAAVLAGTIGWLRPAPEPLRAAVEGAAQAAGIPVPKVYEAPFSHANAMAFQFPGWIVFTSGALKGLDLQEQSAIAAHELGHLREPLAIKLFRVAVGTAAFFAVLGFMPAFANRPMPGFFYGMAAFIVFALLIRVLSRSLERRADQFAREHEREPGVYARALERIYQLNWVAPGVATGAHPSLRDRLAKPGVGPSSANPHRGSRAARLLPLACGLVGAVVLRAVVYPGIASLLG